MNYPLIVFPKLGKFFPSFLENVPIQQNNEKVYQFFLICFHNACIIPVDSLGSSVLLGSVLYQPDIIVAMMMALLTSKGLFSHVVQTG